MRRRTFLGLGATACLLLRPPALLAAGKARGRLVWINLRGAMDALHAVVPATDPAIGSLRAELVEPIAPDLLPLAEGFGLHPALGTLHAWYREKRFSPVLAVASPYRERSHFEAQDVLESGRLPADPDHGWMARALTAAGTPAGDSLAIARSVPVVLRGGPEARTWYPAAFESADDGLHDRLMALYAEDPQLLARLEEGLATRRALEAAPAGKAESRRPQFATLASACGEMLAGNPAIAGAALEMGGWDTHNQQAKRLQKQFVQLDEGLKALRTALGAAWAETLVVVGTEFGRTAAVNGTGGTDHGTGSVMFLAGGAHAGGHLLGDWPGLAPRALHEDRDLRPTSDLRDWLAGGLAAQWGLDERSLAAVFPGVRPKRI